MAKLTGEKTSFPGTKTEERATARMISDHRFQGFKEKRLILDTHLRVEGRRSQAGRSAGGEKHQSSHHVSHGCGNKRLRFLPFHLQ